MWLERLRFNREAAAIRKALPEGRVVGILGSTTFWHAESEATCAALGRRLAEIPRLVLVTGGVEGVGETVGRSFWEMRRKRGDPEALFHVLPRGYGQCPRGTTLVAGADMRERREILARVAPIYVVVEGGPGTAHETEVALSQGRILVPVGRSGGRAAELHGRIAKPEFARAGAWEALASPTAMPEEAARAASDVLSDYFGCSPCSPG